MAIGAIAGSVAGGLASGAATAGLNSLFGGGSQDLPSPRGIRTTGLRLNPAGGPLGNTINIRRLPELRSSLAGFQAASQQAAGGLTDLLSRVTPGFGQVTAARLGAIENRRRLTIGDLRNSLARRRVLGASFAQDTLAAANAEFAQQEAEARASSFLQELDVTNQLIQQRNNIIQTGLQQLINQSNFEAGLGAQFAQAAMGLAAQNAAVAGELAAASAAGTGSFFQGTSDQIGKLVTDVFSGTPTTPTTASSVFGGTPINTTLGSS